LYEGTVNGDFITQEIKIDQGDATIIPQKTAVSRALILELQSFIDVIEGRRKRPLVTLRKQQMLQKWLRRHFFQVILGHQFIWN
jgi:hypothetical protein